MCSQRLGAKQSRQGADGRVANVPTIRPSRIKDGFGLAASKAVCEAIIAPTAADPPLIALDILDDYRFAACVPLRRTDRPRIPRSSLRPIVR